MMNSVTAQEPTPLSDTEAVDAMVEILAAEDKQNEPQVQETAKPEAKQEIDQPEETPVDKPIEEEVTQEVEAKEEVEEDAESETETEVEESEYEAPVIDSIEALAEAIESTPEEVLESLMVDIKVNGEVSRVPVGEAIKGYQRESDYSRRVNEVEDTRKSLTQAQQYAENAAAVIDMMYKQDLEQLEQSRQSIDWNQLRQTDPAEWAAKSQEFQQYEALIAQKYQTAYQQVETDRENRSAEQMQYLLQQTEKSKEVLLEKVPEWRDDTVRSQDMGDIVQYLSGLGYSREELQGILDPRVMQVARDAMMYQKAKTAKPVEKQVKRKVKVLKPGTRQKPVERKKQQTDKLFKKAVKAQTDEAWADALEAKLGF